MAAVSQAEKSADVAPWRRLAVLPAVEVDVAIAVVLAMVNIVSIAALSGPGGRQPDALAYGLGLVSAASLLLRRRWPLAALLITIACEISYNVAAYPSGGPWPAILVALYTAALIGDRRRTLIVGVGITAGIAADHTLVTGAPTLSQGLTYAAIGAAMLFLGDSRRWRRALVAETRERVRQAEAEREAEAGRRVAEERLRIARELHDVMAHTITVITVQAGVAADVLDTRPDQARTALNAIRDASREALREVRATVGLLRESEGADAPKAPAPGLGQIAGLVEMATSAGLHVELSVDGDIHALPAAVDLTAYRIVQEALTNVLRHAQASTATVAIRCQAGTLLVEIDDDGRGLSAQPRGVGSGHGLAGMMERAAAVGGCVETGPKPDGGFRVRAVLPLEGPAT